jgi:gliding motility-associated-like protein
MGDSVRLIPLSITTLPIKWQWTPKDFIDCDTCPAIWAKPPVPTKYRLLIYDTLSKCEKEGFVSVNTNTNCAVFIPTAFSPNDDRVNDVLKIYLDKCIKRVKRFGLYSRWGNQIIESNFSTQDSPRELDLWDGFIEGKVASNEVYVYFVEVEYINGASKIIAGDVTLVR